MKQAADDIVTTELSDQSNNPINKNPSLHNWDDRPAQRGFIEARKRKTDDDFFRRFKVSAILCTFRVAIQGS